MVNSKTAIFLAATLAQGAFALPKTCTPTRGTRYVAQKNPFEWKEAKYSNFEASAFHTVAAIPESKSPATTRNVGFEASSGKKVLYSHGAPIDIQYVTIQHQAFLKNNCKTKKTYTFTIPGRNDNIFLFWKGDNAVSGYTRANADHVVLFKEQDQTFTIELEPGKFIPLRWMAANGYGPNVMDFRVTDQDGKSCFAKDGKPAADCFYTEICCATAPKFGTFGQE